MDLQVSYDWKFTPPAPDSANSLRVCRLAISGFFRRVLQDFLEYFLRWLRRELPARGFFGRRRQRLTFGFLQLFGVFTSKARLLTGLPPLGWLTIWPYSTPVWAAAGAQGARDRITTLRAMLSSLLMVAVLKRKLRRGLPAANPAPAAEKEPICPGWIPFRHNQGPATIGKTLNFPSEIT